jgi:glycosyltransferase involved in cell wall biosynthesis
LKALVTVAVATYHSAPWIVETLESIYNQTYPNLALVVSDDCSTDDTITIIKNWAAQERVQNRFHSVEVITVEKNTGVSANCNRCLAVTPSDWLKFLGGDDILFPNCIEDNMAFVDANPQANIIFSQIKLYQDTFEEKNHFKTTPEHYPDNLMKASLTTTDQYQLLLVSDRIHYTPSFFSKKQALLKVGGYDEWNRMVEDYPMWLKLTASGERLYYFHKVTVGYRIHSKAINNVGDNVLFKPSLFNSFEIRKKTAHPFLPWEMVASEHYVFWISRFFQTMGWNKKSGLNSFLYRIGCFYSNPFYYFYSIKRRLPSNKNNLFYS